MVMDTELVEEGIELDVVPETSLGTILIIEDDPRMQNLPSEQSSSRSTMLSSWPATVKPDSSYFVVNGRSLWF